MSYGAANTPLTLGHLCNPVSISAFLCRFTYSCLICSRDRMFVVCSLLPHLSGCIIIENVVCCFWFHSSKMESALFGHIHQTSESERSHTHWCLGRSTRCLSPPPSWSDQKDACLLHSWSDQVDPCHLQRLERSTRSLSPPLMERSKRSPPSPLMEQ